MEDYAVSSVSIDMDEYRELLDVQFRYNNDLRQLRQRANDLETDNSYLANKLLQLLSKFDSSIIDKVSDQELREDVNKSIVEIQTSIGRHALDYFSSMANIKGTDEI